MGIESRNNYKGALWDAGDVLCLHQGDGDVCVYKGKTSLNCILRISALSAH